MPGVNDGQATVVAMRSERAAKRHEEDVCAAIVASDADARFERRDAGGGQQLHDFDLIFPDGSVEALEVCSFTDPVVRAQWTAVGALDVTAPTLASSWTVAPAAGVRVKRLPKQAEPHLAVFERHGRQRFVAGDHFTLARGGAPDLVAAATALARLGIRDASVTVTEPGESSRVIIAAGVGGVGSRMLINGVVERVAAAEDNQKKLAQAVGARRRHLFIPVDVTGGPAFTVVREQPPATAPRMPTAVDVAWVTGANGRTLAVERGGAWRVVAVDPKVWDNPHVWGR